MCIAISYLDRFLSTDTPRAQAATEDREIFQLAVMACLYTAIKITEPMRLRIDLLSGLSNGRHSPSDILQMESDVLHALQWRLSGPTALSYVEQFLTALSPKHPSIRIHRDDILDDARYQIELSVAESSMMTQRRNDVAIAALTNSIQRIVAIRSSVVERMSLTKTMGEVAQTDLTSRGLLRLARDMQGLQDGEEVPCIRKRRVVLSPSCVCGDGPWAKLRGSSPKFVGNGNERDS